MEITRVIDPERVADYLFIASIFLLLLLIINLILNCICNRFTYRILYPFVFIGSALSLCFVSQYGTLINADMIQNIFDTNLSEVTDFLNTSVVLYLFFLGILPSILILKIQVIHDSFKPAFWFRFKFGFLSIVTIFGILYVNYPSYASMARNQRHISHLIIPTNFIFAGLSYISQQAKTSNEPLQLISQDATLGESWVNNKDKTIVVLVVGETARADHFGINGYNKQTTPRLSQRKLLNFKQVESCGTSTAISLPCIFSQLSRDNFSLDMANNSENLLDFFARTNFSVQWRDNNTGCKGICNRVDFLDLSQVKNNPFCTTGECFDEILLHDLSSQILNNPNHQVIVMHQKGSHGPSYYLRYPQDFEIFTPVCNSSELQSCTQVEVNNAYDNTIVYTDYIIDEIIHTLEELPKSYNTSLVYISDHGESLGEGNIYLHGAPYFIAPSEQTHIPFFMWFSDNFKNDFGIDDNCLILKQEEQFSQDNFFHSILGLMNIQTKQYLAEKDIFSSCKNKFFSKPASIDGR